MQPNTNQLISVRVGRLHYIQHPRPAQTRQNYQQWLQYWAPDLQPFFDFPLRLVISVDFANGAFNAGHDYHRHRSVIAQQKLKNIDFMNVNEYSAGWRVTRRP